MLIVHDLLLAPKGITAPAKHPLRLSVERHRARLAAELTRARVKRGFATIEAFGQSLNQDEQDGKVGGSINEGTIQARKYLQPRWLRINTLRTTLEAQLSTTFAEYNTVPTLNDILASSKPSKIFYIDKHIPSLLALPRSTNLSTLSAFTQGLLIAQDKASCFPAYLLNPHPKDGSIIDACAAPGNKTTHLAALLRIQTATNGISLPKIYACEKDKFRAQALQKMLQVAGAANLVTLHAGQDFLRLDPDKEPWSNVGALLLDPSCSGSGIVGRDEKEAAIVLPTKTSGSNSYPEKSRSRKRKRNPNLGGSPSPVAITASEEVDQSEVLDSDSQSALRSRLATLSVFQSKLLLHAFSFPSAMKITYSTCSTYAEENEMVVWKVLLDTAARGYGWRVLRRKEQVKGMREWEIRGDAGACGLNDGGEELDVEEARGKGLDEVIRRQSRVVKERVRDACIRCEMGTKEGTQGFFVVGFVRGAEEGLVSTAVPNGEEKGYEASKAMDEEEEWEGISHG